MGTSLFESEDPSAIGNMMSLLSQTPASAQGAGQMPHIDAAPPSPVQPSQMPLQPTPTFAQQPQPPRLVDRIHHRLQGLLDSVRPSDPTGGYGGILSPDQIEKAKPGRMESLIERVAGLGSDVFTKQAYQQNLDRAAEMQKIADNVKEQRRVLAGRETMRGMFHIDPNATHEQQNAQLEQMYAYAVQNGDEKTVKALGTVVDDIAKQRQFMNAGDGTGTFFDPTTKTWLHDPNASPTSRAPVMGSPEWLDAQEALATIRQRHHVGGISGEPLVQVEGPAGPVWTRRSEAAGMPAKNTTHVESAMGVAAKARLTAAVSEMNNAHAGMAEYERGLANGSIKIGASAQLLQRIGNSFTHDDPASMILQSAALSALNQSDPALARYIRRGLSFAEGESMVSQRPSDFRTKMAAFLSTAASGASPDMVGDIQSRRTSILTPLNAVSAEHSPSKGNDRATGKVPSYEEWKKAHGH